MRHAVLAAGGGFLVAVVWMDLMFDVQVWQGPPAPAPLPESVVASIAAYYARVTTQADPMSRLIGAVMAVVIGGAVWDVVRTPSRPSSLVALALAGLPIGLAGWRVFPNAVVLGARTGTLEEQSALARGICTDHVLCWTLIFGFTLVQIAAARAARGHG